MEARGVTPIIPMRRSRKVQIPIDDYLYALRNRIERCFNRLKNWRRLATRYDKTADSYLGFVLIAASAYGCAHSSTGPRSLQAIVAHRKGEVGNWR